MTDDDTVGDFWRDVLSDRIYALTNEILADEEQLVAALNAFYGHSDMHELIVAWYLDPSVCATEQERAVAGGVEAAARWAAEKQI